MLTKRPQAKTTSVSAQSGLSPQVIIRMKARKLLKAAAHVGVEGLQSLSMKTGKDGSDGVDHLAKTGAAPEQLQSHLWV